MLFKQRHLSGTHSCKCFPTKGNLHFPIHSNAFRPKATCILLFVQMLFEQRHLTLSLASPASRPKATFTAAFIQMLFFKRHFSAAIEANAFIQKALFCRHWSKCFYTKRHFFCSPLKQMLFISLISNLSNFHLLSECYVISLGPSLACIFIKCRRPGSYPSRLQALRNCKYAEWHKEYRDLRLKPNTTRWRVV
nr:hypothetical protein [Escherichia coli]